MTIRATRFILALAWTAAAGAAAAVPITVDPQAFGGSYSIVGVLPAPNIGPQSFDLAPGTYSLDIGTAGSCSRKSFVVNGDGSVANSPTLDSSGALEFAGSTVRLRNTPVVIAGGAYQGTAWLQTSISSPFVSLPLTGITQDEPVDGTGDGDTRPDATVAGGKVLLRAERAGSGNGRVYRVPFTATSSGQSCSGAFEVSVPRNRGEPAIDDGQSYPSN